MAPRSLFLLVTAGILVILQATAGSDDVLCYADVNQVTGECEDYLGDGVSEVDCCLNQKYGYKLDAQSPCRACRPAEWSLWGEWSPCTVSCLNGVQKRERICLGDGDCDGNSLEVQVCSLRDCCPQNGGWSPWSNWSPCSVTCEKGQRKRTRQCNNPAPVCGGTCRGNAEEIEKCDTLQICPTHGNWGAWGDWGKCSSTCMEEGSGIFPSQSRFRLCDNPAPSSSPPGNPCPGSNRDVRDCTTLPFCPVNGQWGAWQKDSDCLVTCGVGRERQKRSCDSPAPKHGGKDCDGSPIKHIICNTKKPCIPDPAWGNWEEWTTCKRLTEDDVTCKKRVALQHRKRTCKNADTEDRFCEGERRESRSCYNVEGCEFTELGTWTEWSNWGLCSSPCGYSERTRFRECQPKYPNYPTTVPGATKVVEVFFWGTPEFECAGINGQTKRLEETQECKNTPPCT